ISIITIIILLFYKDQILSILNVETLNYYIYLIPLVVLFAALKQVGEQWLIRTDQFMINAKSNLVRSIIINSSKVSVGFIYPYAIVLIILETISEGFQAFLIFLMSRKSSYKVRDNEKNVKSLKYLAKKHIDFPLYRAPEQLFSSISQNLQLCYWLVFLAQLLLGFTVLEELY